MSKHEQERRIETIKGSMAQFDKPTPTIESAQDACMSCVGAPSDEHLRLMGWQMLLIITTRVETMIARRAKRSRSVEDFL